MKAWSVVRRLSIGALLLTPAIGYAQNVFSKPIVPESCNVPGGCQSVCDIATVAQNVLNAAIFLAIFLAAILFAYAGWKYLTAGGGEGISEARRIFANVLVGLLIILGAWLLVDTLMKSVMGGSFGPWNKICEIFLSHFEHFYA